MYENELAGLLAEDLEQNFPLVVAYYTPRLFSLCAKMVGSEAEDIVQQTMMQVYIRFKGRDPAWFRSLNLRAYLFQSARNECYKCLKRSQAGPVPLSVVYETHFETLFDDPWNTVAIRQDLAEAIGGLPRIYQHVLYLYYGKDLQVKEIARRLGELEVTIRSRLSRARDMLRVYFGVLLEEKEKGEEKHE
jgi:RNA polymerase sigma-70 factor (ECF subfamily)